MSDTKVQLLKRSYLVTHGKIACMQKLRTTLTLKKLETKIKNKNRKYIECIITRILKMILRVLQTIWPNSYDQLKSA